MKKFFCLLIALLFLLSATALANDSLDATIKMNGRNASFTLESYPGVVITPVFADYIITGLDPEKYPARFLQFAPPEGALPLMFRSDVSSFLDYDALLQYSYYAYDRMAFELFLEKAEPESIVKDGGDGVAIFVNPDSRRARAMIDLKEQYGGTAKLEIEIYDHSTNRDTDELKLLIEDEVARIQTDMIVVDDSAYWSRHRYNSVELYDDNNDAGITVDTTNWTITQMEANQLVSKEKKPDSNNSTIDTEIEIGTYLRDDAVDATLSDGTEYKVHNMEYTGYAFFYLKPGKYSGDVYLEISIGVGEADFEAALEEVYKRITIKE